MEKHKRINRAYKIFFVLLTVLPLLAANAWSFNERITWQAVTQSGGAAVFAKLYPAYKEQWKGLEEIALGCADTGVGTDFAWTRLTVVPDFKIVSSSGAVVVDEVCAGDTITVMAGASKGEFWSDGGNVDSPPVYWVVDAEDTALKLIDKIVDLYKAGKYEPAKNCFTGACGQIPSTDSYVDDLPNLVVYKSAAYVDQRNVSPMDDVYEHAFSIYGKLFPVDSAMVCSLNKKNETVEGLNPLPPDSYVVVGVNGNARLVAKYELRCMYYMARYYLPEYTTPSCLLTQYPLLASDALGMMPASLGGMDLLPGLGKNPLFGISNPPGCEGFIMGSEGIERTLRVVDPAKADVEVSVPASDNLVFGEANTLRVLVRNVGDADVSIKKVSASGDYKFVSCDSEVVKPGEEAECLISVTPQMGQGLKVFVDYEYKSCGKTKTGKASKVLIESTAVAPAASAQVYSIDVHGGCENQYYGCYAPDNDGKFAAGYKCYNTGDQYYSPVRERFDLRFVLPDLSSKTVLGASLNLFATNVNRAQGVRVFSGKVDWAPTSCSASGDICARPYCEQCAPMFDFAGGAERAAQTIGSGGKVSFDLSDLARAYD